MNEVRNLRWFFVGVSIGLVLFAIGALVSSTRGFAPPTSTSPARVGDAAVPRTVDAGLRIECRNDDECIQSSHSDWNDGRGPLRRKFLRMRIYNDGPRTAEGCRVTLRGITEVMPNGLMSTAYDGRSLLIWSGDRSARHEGKVIRRNANPEVADLFYTVHHPGGDEIYLKDEGYGSFLGFGKTYFFEVVASAGSGGAVGKNIKVRFGPTWDDFEVVID
jgi:hypothetical protein